MSESVVRLKQLLFDSESQTLAELRHRIEHLGATSREERERLANEISNLASREAGYRLELTQRLDTIFKRAGTLERFQSTVAEVLDRALKDAEIDRHAQLSEAIAPLVTRTIKTEITNSRDELVEALYPMTGRMVQAYVSSAITDMMEEINRRIGQNKTMLRLRSLVTGRSVAELAMVETYKLDVQELIMIRRASGELLERWPKSDARDNIDHLVSGVTTAVNNVAAEAWDVNSSGLRRLEVANEAVFFRTSPNHFLIARCRGVAHASVEKIMDEEFLNALDDQRAQSAKKTASTSTGADGEDSTDTSFLEGVADRLNARIKSRQQELRTGGFNPAKILLWLIGLAAAAWLAWWAYATYQTETVRSTALAAVERQPDLQGYPIDITVAPYGAQITISGLTPSPESQSALIADLEATLPDRTTLIDKTTVVASADAKIKPEVDRLKLQVSGLEQDVQPKVDQLSRDVSGLTRDVPTEVAKLQRELQGLRATVARNAIMRAVSRTANRLSATGPQLEQLAASLADRVAPPTTQRVIAGIEAAAGTLANTDFSETTPLDDIAETITTVSTQIEAAADTLTAAVGPGLSAASGRTTIDLATGLIPPSGGAEAALVERAEILALKAEHLATLVTAINQAASLAPVTKLTERQRLEAFAKANAVFFSTDTDYRDTAAARNTLKNLVDTARDGTLLIRVVGYTDGTGTRDNNQKLALDRAEKVVADLIGLGMPTDRLIAVGRADARNIAPVAGDNSPNRRVQFEIGYIGEAAR